MYYKNKKIKMKKEKIIIIDTKFEEIKKLKKK